MIRTFITGLIYKIAFANNAFAEKKDTRRVLKI